VDFDAVTGELYALPPAEFIPAREQRVAEARAAGDRELAKRIHALRRPTHAAWAVNLLAREQPETCDGLLSLGSELRQAWSAADGEQLAELSSRRHQVVYALAQLVRRLAYEHGLPLSDDAAEDVQATLDAALADPGVAREVCSGRLAKGRTFAGFGPADAPAPPAGTARQTRPEPGDGTAAATEAPAGGAGTKAAGGRARSATGRGAGVDERSRAAEEERRRVEEERRRAEEERRRAERERLARLAAEAAEAAAEAEAALAEVAEGLTGAESDRAAAEAEVDRLEEELAAARERVGEYHRRQRKLARDRDLAARRADAARRRAEQAQARLDRLP
jgi:DNA repair exonuclease SbcCD ATPase subunit